MNKGILEFVINILFMTFQAVYGVSSLGSHRGKPKKKGDNLQENNGKWVVVKVHA